jgi:DNA invertase Pin-like site-specific DNA recombinase
MRLTRSSRKPQTSDEKHAEERCHGTRGRLRGRLDGRAGVVAGRGGPRGAAGQRGPFGLLATNTIAQGDTREASLGAIVAQGGAIYSAQRRFRWPGDAAVILSAIHVLKDAASREYLLDGVHVERISAFLLPGQADATPVALAENAGRGYVGGKVWGAGFVFEDNPSGGSSSLDDMRRLISSDNQKDTSIDDQVRLCRDLLVRQNGSVSDEFVLSDYAISGVSKARAGFDQLLRLIESRAVDLVVTESADRLSRDLGDADRLWKLCEFHNVRLICASDGIDSARDGSRMQFQFKAVLSDQYLVNLGKQTLRGLRGAATRGTSTGGLPYGYRSEPIWNGGREPDGFKILIHEEQARIVVRIFEMYLDGKSLLTIAKTLNDEAVPPPRAASKKRAAKFWRKVSVYHMLKNRAYVGDWTFGKKRWRKDPTTRKRRYTLRPESEVQVLAVDLGHAADGSLRNAPLADDAVHARDDLGAVRERHGPRVQLLEVAQAEVHPGEEYW